MIGVETDVSGDWDSRIDWPALARSAVHAAVAHSRHPGIGSDSEISVKFTDDDEVRALNAAWRGKDEPTNVLSFPMANESELADAQLLGDIVLAHGVCAGEASQKRIPIEHHAALMVHGTLHLLGYATKRACGGEEMECVERAAPGRVGIADPYMSEVQSNIWKTKSRPGDGT